MDTGLIKIRKRRKNPFPCKTYTLRQITPGVWKGQAKIENVETHITPQIIEISGVDPISKEKITFLIPGPEPSDFRKLEKIILYSGAYLGDRSFDGMWIRNTSLNGYIRDIEGNLRTYHAKIFKALPICSKWRKNQ